MGIDFKLIQDKLIEMRKPARYLGNEFNVELKDPELNPVKIALAFPDLYELGMSFLGYKILYHLINSQEGIMAERVFTPDLDLGDYLKEKNIPLFSLENKLALSEFDMVGFTLQYELSYTNILWMLDLGGIPRYTRDRKETDPIIVGGGPCAFNPEPLADFFDFFVIGEAEEVLLKVIEIYKTEYKNLGKKEFLKKIDELQGIYVPELFPIKENANGITEPVHYLNPDKKVKKEWIKDFGYAYYPDKTLVPHIQIVHDRVALEIMRGCSRGCRFCQAGMIYRPRRERNPDHLFQLGVSQINTSGYDEISFSSLSSTDYSCIERLSENFLTMENPVAVSLPSMRIDQFSVALAEQIQTGLRRTGFTFAPEAGSQRMRDIINKNLSEQEILDAADRVFKNGWKTLKFYFMYGLPFEIEDDLLEIAKLIEKVLNIGEKYHGRAVRLNVSFSLFNPKSHTPFQWEGQNSKIQAEEKKELLIQKIKRFKSVRYSFSNYETSQLEAVFARGGRELSRVIENAYILGCKMDGWGEYFNYKLWSTAFENQGLNPEILATQAYPEDSSLPWDHIDSGIHADFFREEKNKAEKQELNQCCGVKNCKKCGVC